MSKRKNRTSSLRGGFDYQDLWALKLCGEWLLNPEKFKWIQIEANPTEDHAFYLDDIVLLDNQDLLHLYQAKFKADAQYQWSWNDLIKPKDRARESLLKKWSKSFHDTKTKKAALMTNGAFSDEIISLLDNQKINIQKLKGNPGLYEHIKMEIGDDDSLKAFFEKFEFISENRSINEIEEEIVENLFLNSLRATINGVNNLLLKIKREARKQHTDKLRLDQIKSWCEFDNPRPLNEDFEVPSDFQLFDNATHKNILQDLQKSDGGTKVVFGRPGVGKSVYLSQLSEDIKCQDIVVIKHHYHINPSDSNLNERLNFERVIEAIKAQFKSREFTKYIGELANQNSKGIDLREFISSVAYNLYKDSNNFVIIIDGLDHVIREKDIHELKDFLDELFYPQKGLWIVFGMQPQVKNEPILQPIFNECSKKDWVEIKGLSKVAVFNLIEENITDLNLPDNQKIFNDLVGKIWESTQGNSLHLRYTLTQLKNRLDNSPVTEYECRDLIPYGDNIEKYYESLWRKEYKHTYWLLLVWISNLLVSNS